MKRENLTEFIKLPFMPEALTIDDFVSNIERRIRKNIRANSMIKAHEDIVLPNDDSINTKVLNKLLLRLKKKLPFNIVKKNGKILSSENLLDSDISFMNMLLFKKKEAINKNAPLNVVHSEEIELLANYFKIQYSEPILTQNKKELLTLEKKYPSILFNIRKSRIQLD